jgi:hypothetical protein
MTTPSLRCPYCKTVLNPQWTQCRVCRRFLSATASSTAPMQNRLKPGTEIVYRNPSAERSESGRVASTSQDTGRLTITLEGGLRIGDGQVRAISERQTDGTLIRAYLTRYEGTPMTPTTTTQATPAVVLSDDYQHWKELATASFGITPDQPRFQRVRALLDQCESAFQSGQHERFLQVKRQTLNYIAASNPRAKPDRSSVA